MKTQLALIKLDTTNDLRKAKTRRTVGKLEEVYLINLNQTTNLCEITPSYWLEFVEFWTEKEIPDSLMEALESEINTMESSKYYHVGIEKQHPCVLIPAYDFEYEDHAAYEEKIQEIIDDFRGNTTYGYFLGVRTNGG